MGVRKFFKPLVLILVIVGTLADLLAGVWWGFGLVAEMRPLVIGAGIFGLLLYFLPNSRKQLTQISILSGAIIVNLLWILPYFGSGQSETITTNRWVISHVAWGGSGENVAGFVSEGEADLVFVQELQPWLGGVDQEISGYEPILLNALENTHGVGVWAREGRAVEAEVLIITEASQRPLIIFETDDFVGMSVHVTRPRTPQTSKSKQDELNAIKNWVTAQTKPVILIGDFNSTPWTRAFHHFLDETELTLNPHGGTWPAVLPAWMSLPIDHALIAEELTMIDQTVGFLNGSDHRPLTIRVGVDE